MMTAGVLLLTALAGGLGAVLRWVLEQLAQRAGRSSFPWGVFVVNTVGSFAMGIVAGTLSGSAAQIVGVGLLGGFTTFSSVAAASAAMLERRRPWPALFNAFGTFAIAVALAALGYLITAG